MEIFQFSELQSNDRECKVSIYVSIYPKVMSVLHMWVQTLHQHDLQFWMLHPWFVLCSVFTFGCSVVGTWMKNIITLDQYYLHVCKKNANLLVGNRKKHHHHAKFHFIIITFLILCPQVTVRIRINICTRRIASLMTLPNALVSVGGGGAAACFRLIQDWSKGSAISKMPLVKKSLNSWTCSTELLKMIQISLSILNSHIVADCLQTVKLGWGRGCWSKSIWNKFLLKRHFEFYTVFHPPGIFRHKSRYRARCRSWGRSWQIGERTRIRSKRKQRH